MSKPKVLIEISGGNIQRVVSTQDLEITVIDHDNMKQGDEMWVGEPDAVLSVSSFFETRSESIQKYEKPCHSHKKKE